MRQCQVLVTHAKRPAQTRIRFEHKIHRETAEQTSQFARSCMVEFESRVIKVAQAARRRTHRAQASWMQGRVTDRWLMVVVLLRIGRHRRANLRVPRVDSIESTKFKGNN